MSSSAAWTTCTQCSGSRGPAASEGQGPGLAPTNQRSPLNRPEDSALRTPSRTTWRRRLSTSQAGLCNGSLFQCLRLPLLLGDTMGDTAASSFLLSALPLPALCCHVSLLPNWAPAWGGAGLYRPSGGLGTGTPSAFSLILPPAWPASSTRNCSPLGGLRGRPASRHHGGSRGCP